MTGKAPLFGGRPSDPSAWVRRKEQPASPGGAFTARLTIDVTPGLRARFVLNRCAARTVIARDTAAELKRLDPPALPATIGQRVAFAEAARHARLVDESEGDSAAAREIAGFARAVREAAP